MGYVALVEANTGDRLVLLHNDGQLGGKALGAFLVPLDAYCRSGGDPEMKEWLAKLEAYPTEPICRLAQPLFRCYYSGELNREEDALSWLLHHVAETSLKEEQVQRMILELDEKWVDARSLLTLVNEVARLLRTANPEATWWYDPHWTLLDFEALSRALALAVERHAERVRIKFT